MPHPVYRGLKSRDTLFGLELYDLVILGAVTNVLFRVHHPEAWFGKILNIAIIALLYGALVVFKRNFPKDYIQNNVMFLFQKRRFRPLCDDELKPLVEVLNEKK